MCFLAQQIKGVDEKINEAFIVKASKVLGATDSPLTLSMICEHCLEYAAEYNRDIPYSEPPSNVGEARLPNKRTALQKNLEAFTPREQYVIIRYLCNLKDLASNESVQRLRLLLFRHYAHLAPDDEDTGEVIQEAKDWLEKYSDAFIHYQAACLKYRSGNRDLYRNALDDLRLSLEELLKKVLGNEKSLENQMKSLGGFVEAKGGSKEFSNGLWKVLDWYSRYQNERVKHKEAVVEGEVSFIFELTVACMRQIVRLDS